MLTELKKIGIDIFFFVAGASGVFVANRKKPNFKWWTFIMDMTAGGLSAMFITPVFTDIIRVGHSGELALAFGIGSMGYKAVDILIEFITTKMKKQ